MSVALIIVLAGAVAGCREDHASLEDVIDACIDFEVAAGKKFGECLGWSQAMIDDYTANNAQTCEGKVQPNDSCWDIQRNSYVNCTERVKDRDCSRLCSSTSCSISCGYTCPQVQREGDPGQTEP